MPEFLPLTDVVREHILTVLNQAVADGVNPDELWAAIVESPHYDYAATRTLRPRVAQVVDHEDEDKVWLVYEGDKNAPPGLAYEWQEPAAAWGEFIAFSDHFRRAEDGTWTVRE